MRTRAAILWEPGTPWKVEEIELDPPRAGEVLVRLGAAGLCHSDEHLVTGDLEAFPPVVGGHEGAGVIEDVGPGVSGLAPGDHVVFGFLPACGQCPSCATGHSNLCDLGATLLFGRQLDGTSRHHAGEHDLSIFLGLGTFAEHTVVSQASCVRIPDDIAFDRACLVGCGVTTGWGSALYAAEVRPGEDVAVVGIGGIGASAVQGARLAGAGRIFAIDPVAFKREQATRFGATHSAASIDEAAALIAEQTAGRMCDKVICAMGVGRGDLLQSIMGLAAKRGRVVVTNIHPMAEQQVQLSLFELAMWEKQLVGTIFGSANIRADIPRLLDLYRRGLLDLDGLITRTYDLDGVNDGYQDLRDGRNLRGVLRLG